MKEILLFLMRSYKWYIAILIGILVIVVIGIQAINGFFDLDSVLASLIMYIFFVATLWNVKFGTMPSVDENSNGAAIFSRWGLILISLCLLLYGLLDPIYAN